MKFVFKIWMACFTAHRKEKTESLQIWYIYNVKCFRSSPLSADCAAWLSNFTPKSAWPIWSSWSTVSSDLGLAHLPREPNDLWPAQTPVLTHGGSFHMLVPKLWALPAQIQTDVLAWTLLCHGQDLGNSMGKRGEQYPTVHMGLRKSLQAWRGPSSLHIIRPQKTSNCLQISHFSTTTTYLPRLGRCCSLVSSPGQVFGNNWVFHECPE